MEELTLDVIRKAIDCLDEAQVDADTFYIDGVSFYEMPEEVKARIKWAFDHIYISSNIERLKDANL